MKIQEIGKVITGKTPPTREKKFFNGEYPFITPTDIQDYNVRFLEQTERNLSQEWANIQPKCLLPPNTICYVCIGSTVGKICMNRIPSFTNQQINSIICDSKVANPFYVFYKLKLETPKIKSIASARGVGKSIMNKTDFENLEVDVADLTNQNKIASVLSAYDDLIENNNRRIKILEEIAQTIYNEWFVKFRFPGHSKVKMVSSELGEIPQGWGIRKIDDVIDIQSGFAFKSKTFAKNGQYGIVTIKNVQDGRFIGECQSYINEFPDGMPKHCLLRDGDILLSLTGNVGRVCLVYGDNYLLNQRVAKLIPKDSFNFAYVYFSYFQSDFRIRLEKLATGVAQQNLSPIEMGKMKIIYPDDSTLKSYAGVCNPILEDMIILFRKNAILQRSRDLLLPRFISGEIDVKHLDIKTEDTE